jgi:NAD(P)-dependent dehydrogenase (short-subunit alcohol dehydrogenase family)
MALSRVERRLELDGNLNDPPRENRLKDLAGKIAFVTGAASGIGLGIATALAQAGVKVMLCDIEEAALAAAIEGLKRTNADVASTRADVSLKAELQAAAEETRARYGGLHILINNAGVGGAGPYGTWNDAGWNWTLGVNLMAVVWGVEIFAPMIESNGGGHIVSTASIAASASVAALTRSTWASSCARVSRTTGPTFSPTASSSR